MTYKFFSTFILLFFICNSSIAQEQFWESDHVAFSVHYQAPWELIGWPLDVSDKTLVAFTDPTDNASVMIKIVDDVSKEMLSDKAYYKATINKFLSLHPENQLINEASYKHKDGVFYMITLRLKIKFGDFISRILIRRNQDKMYSIQVSYPYNASLSSEQMPHKVTQLLNGVSL